MIWAKLAVDAAVPLAAWFWHNREQFQPVLDGLGDYVGRAVASPATAVRRVGNALFFEKEDGGEEVLAFIEQTSEKVDDIKDALADTQRHLGVLQVGQAALSTSLASLQTLSMVTLGFTAITPLVLITQFRGLLLRLKDVEKALRALITNQQISALEAGLEHFDLGQKALEEGNPVNARDRFNSALERCLDNARFFGNLLDQELAAAKVNRDNVHFVFRYLSLAIVGAAGCHIALEKDSWAVEKFRLEIPRLQRAARRVFGETVGRDPSPYLLLPPDDGGVTLEFLADLYRQARFAGAADSDQEPTAAAWFERHREKIFRAKPPWFGTARWRATARKELVEAVTVIEETNRIRGLEETVRKAVKTGRNTREVMREVTEIARRHDDDKKCQHLVWAMG